MYYQSYEEYMRDMLGYPNPYSSSNMMSPAPTYAGYGEYEDYRNISNTNRDIEAFYPDIYQVVYPMVCKVCRRNTRNVTRDVLEEMTAEVYANLETNENDNNMEANVKIEVRNNSKPSVNSRTRGEKEDTTRQNNHNNGMLQDLIRVLIIRELLDKCDNRPNPPRPPFPGQNPRPPFPPRPPMPRMDYQDNMYY